MKNKKSHKKQRGSAKSKKKLSKKKDKYMYKAPRTTKDGKMTKASLNTYNPMEEDTKNKAATRIQSLTRGKQSRKTKSDMKSDWYPGFPTNAPSKPLDLEVISRITEGVIQGVDSRTERDKLRNKRDKIYNKYTTELDKLGKLDETKYNWGEYYSEKDINTKPTEEMKELIRFEKKNYDKLKQIADKKNYWRQKVDKINNDTWNEYRKSTPNNITDSQRYNIRSSAMYYIKNPEKDLYDSHYYKGQYFDEDEDDNKYLPDYEIEERPELSSLKSDDTVTYSEDDELLIPREKITDAIDYYKKRDAAESKLLRTYKAYTNKYDKLENELDENLELDIEKCLNAKKMAKADIKLYKDKHFMKNYYEPCSDNDNLTQIYIETFYSLPWELINPTSKLEWGERIDDMIRNIPKTGWKNSIITNEGQKKLREILLFQGLLDDPYSEYINHNKIALEYGNRRSKFDIVVELSNFYRWAVRGSIRLVHISGHPNIVSKLPGKSHLQETFNMLDDAFEENPEYFNGNVEKVKRYFILRLIGLIGNPDYKEFLNSYINKTYNTIIAFKSDITTYEEDYDTNIQILQEIMKKYNLTEKDINKNVFDEYRYIYKVSNTKHRELLGRMINFASKLEEIEKKKVKILKLKKNLEMAKRFSRISSTKKDYMTWEADKIIYE
jgi:hypothetical protein